MNKNNTLLFDPPHILSPDVEPPKCGDALCHDWNSYVVPAGFIHHIGCDCEECPRCQDMWPCYYESEYIDSIPLDDPMSKMQFDIPPRGNFLKETGYLENCQL